MTYIKKSDVMEAIANITSSYTIDKVLMLPTIDPIATIDAMIIENKKIYDSFKNPSAISLAENFASIGTLEELKSRLSISPNN